jgi:nucleoside-diphosphate-sugar epimerase
VSRVLVTGASGFIGAHVLAPMARRGLEVHAVTSRATPPDWNAPVRWHHADLLKSGSIDPVVAELRPTHLLHLAWSVEPGRFWTSPENHRWVEASLALLDSFAAVGGARAVMAGTCAEYQWGGDGRLSADATPLRPASLYGKCKLALHAAASERAAGAGVTLAWGRIFFPYGPGERPERLVPSVASALLAGERAKVTTGEQIRDFIYIADVAAAFAALVTSDFEGPINVASGVPVAVGTVVETIGRATGRPELIEFGALPQRPAEPRRLVADVSPVVAELGFRPSVALDEGIDRTVQWLRRRMRRDGG